MPCWRTASPICPDLGFRHAQVVGIINSGKEARAFFVLRDFAEPEGLSRVPGRGGAVSFRAKTAPLSGPKRAPCLTVSRCLTRETGEIMRHPFPGQKEEAGLLR